MSRKETIWGARHTLEGAEIDRIVKNYRDLFGIDITKLEASAIQAMRSQDVFWNDKKARDAIMKLRGIL